MHLDLDPLLARQRGLVTTEQAKDAGISAARLAALGRRGLLKRVHRGVYRDPSWPVTTEQRRQGAVLAAGAGAALSHRTAAHHLGARNFRCAMLELSRPGPRPVRIDGLTVHRMRDLEPDDVLLHDGVATTTPLRTALDAVTVMPPVVVMRFVEQWAVERRLDLDELDRRLHRTRGRAGSAKLRRLLDSRDLGRVVPDSVPEGELGAVLVRRGLPTPTHHHLVTLSSGATYELDWSYPELLVALELDGYGIHVRSFEAFEGDRWRHNDLVAEGWAVLSFTTRALRRSPQRVTRQAAETLELQARRLAG